MNDADLKSDGESPKWHYNTKFLADIHNERTNPWNHKEGIANIVKKINKITLIDKISKEYHKTAIVDGIHNPLFPLIRQEPEKPCSDDQSKFGMCLQSEGMSNDEVSACNGCIQQALLDHTLGGCSLYHVYWYCSKYQNCKETMCTKEFTTSCWDEAIEMIGCVLEYNGCDKSEFESECYPDYDRSTSVPSPPPINVPLPSPAPNNVPLPSPAPSSSKDTEPFDPDAGPCQEYYNKQYDCLVSNGLPDDQVLACYNCETNALQDVGSIYCSDLKEEGFCDEVLNCWDTYCNNVCYDEGVKSAGCMLHYSGCDNYEFKSECIPGM